MYNVYAELSSAPSELTFEQAKLIRQISQKHAKIAKQKVLITLIVLGKLKVNLGKYI